MGPSSYAMTIALPIVSKWAMPLAGATHVIQTERLARGLQGFGSLISVEALNEEE